MPIRELSLLLLGLLYVDARLEADSTEKSQCEEEASSAAIGD